MGQKEIKIYLFSNSKFYFEVYILVNKLNLEVEIVKYKSLRDLRLSKGLLQRDIADKTRVSVPFYSMVESGIRIPSLRCSKKISSILGISLDEFYRLTENNKNKI